MEKSRSGNQAIRVHNGNHVKDEMQFCMKMVLSESRETLQGTWGNDSTFEGAPKATRPHSNHLPASNTPSAWTYKRRWRGGNTVMVAWMSILVASLCIVPGSAVFIDFQNCLSNSYQKNTPLQLQFVPKFFNAVFDSKQPDHNLNVTLWGNVAGSGPDHLVILPDANNTDYWGSNQTNLGGKILNLPEPDDPQPKITTLFTKINVLTYEPYSSSSAFCSELNNGTCPLAPVFNVNESDPYVFPSVGFNNNFFSSYAFTSFTATLSVVYGDSESTTISCVSANITPDLGSSLSGVLMFLPLVVLVFVGVATAFAAIYSPWGTTDIFRWTTNYGRDADLLRLVTPGFGDCLQYIQFIALTGGLTLNYPGFYQPVVSKVAWSALMFNESFVGNRTGRDSVVDGIYVTHAKYGLDVLRQLVGMRDVDDVWAGMAIWLLVIIGAILTIIQLGFLLRWISRVINSTQEEDLRAKNMPFSMGNVIRLVFNYFLLPVVALSMFQLVVVNKSPTYTVVLAAVMLVLIVGFAVWLLYLIASTQPKSFLFDELPTVLLYGSLYNTYSDNAAPFALIPVLLTFVRGIAIGAVQPSGVAQLALLAICEVITVLTIHAFRPFHSPTSMNAYHTFFATLRFSTIVLMISFAPSLGVTEGPKGWIGYAILLMHAIVLVFGFLLNAIQTVVEVAARMAGAGGDESGAARGGLVRVFGMRQLSKRLPRRDAASRASQLSSAAMLDNENDRRSYLMDGGRLRSQSAGSTGVLLNRQSTGLESGSIDAFGAIPPQQLGSGNSAYTPTTPGEASSFSFLPSAAAPLGLGRNRGPILGLTTAETADPYYRPPRLRRPTLEAYSPGARSRGSWASNDWANNKWSQHDPANPEQEQTEPFEGTSISGRGTPVSAPPVDGSPSDPRRSKADYTTREVDFYYGVRGPALNANVPSRRIKTGPADPTGIPASAAGWFKGLFGGKTKEKGKGFEVVRSARMPPGMMNARNAPTESGVPEGIPVAAEVVRNGPIDSDDESIAGRPSHAGPSNTAAVTSHADETLVSPVASDDEFPSDDEMWESTRISDVPPMLPGIEIGEHGIELPSRFPSKASSRRPQMNGVANDPLMPDIPNLAPSGKPSVPRKSSRRKSQNLDLPQSGADSMNQHRLQASVDSSQDIPQESLNLPFERSNSSAKSSIGALAETGALHNTSALGNFSADLQNDRPTSVGYVTHHSIRTVNRDPSENPDFLGSSAIVVEGGRRSGASSIEHQQG